MGITIIGRGSNSHIATTICCRRCIIEVCTIGSRIIICRLNCITTICKAILESDDGFSTTSSIPRDKLIRTQTPQTFRATADRHRLSYEFEAFRQLADNRAESQLNIPYLSRVALEIAIALERKQEIV